MLYLVGLFWPWLLLTLACAAIVGWATVGPADGRSRFGGWLPFGALAFLAGLVVAFMQWLPGRAGLWLETGLMFFAAFIVGCCLGAVLRPKTRSKIGPIPQTAAPVAPETTPVAAAMPRLPDEDRHAGRRPAGLAAANGIADNLKLIRGIGPQNERRLHELGIWHFAQIAAWQPDEIVWVGSYLAFPGRIEREGWVAQAITLVGNGQKPAREG